MSTRLRLLIIWMVLLALPCQAQMAVQMDLRGPAHHHQDDPAAGSPSGSLAASPALLLPRDFVAPVTGHPGTERHWHATLERGVIVDPDSGDEFSLADLSTGGFGSMFVVLLHTLPKPPLAAGDPLQRPAEAATPPTRDPPPPQRPPIGI